MTENMYQALLLLGQGMAGIFVVLGVIALLVRLMEKMDQRPKI
ncbi:MAG: OadG-related small transporter subunit [Lawsonibacter sp.]|nr:OadG-related small transporter subunit [Lawsonibacter sp.]